MYSQVQQAVECLTVALDGVDAAPTGELVRSLGPAKSLRSLVELYETKTASAVAARERHGDGGAGLLNQVGGLSRSDAARKIRTETGLAQLPAARSGVAAGEISSANADKLVQAARKTGPQAVQDAVELVQLAKSLPDDEFAQAAQRWTTRQLSAEDLAARHRRLRQQRQVRFWSSDDGAVQMRGSFDTEMGARIQHSLQQQAELLRRTDRQQLKRGQIDSSTGDAVDSPDLSSPGVRTHDQRMADALDGLLRSADVPSTGASQPSDTLTRSGNRRKDSLASDTPESNTAVGLTRSQRTNSLHTDSQHTDSGHTDSARAESQPTDARSAGSRRTDAEIVVRADLDALLGEPGGLAEIAGSGPIPPQVLQRLACNSDLSMVIFKDDLTPLYETTTSRAPTASQRRALIARDSACIGCGAPPDQCEIHHIVPWSCGGKTQIDNLTLVCWSCHDRIHDNNWQVAKQNGRYRLTTCDNAQQVNLARSRKPSSHASLFAPRSGEP